MKLISNEDTRTLRDQRKNKRYFHMQREIEIRSLTGEMYKSNEL